MEESKSAEDRNCLQESTKETKFWMNFNEVWFMYNTLIHLKGRICEFWKIYILMEQSRYIIVYIISKVFSYSFTIHLTFYSPSWQRQETVSLLFVTINCLVVCIILYKWNRILNIVLCLTSFTQHNTFEIYSYCCISSSLFLFIIE